MKQTIVFQGMVIKEMQINIQDRHGAEISIIKARCPQKILAPRRIAVAEGLIKDPSNSNIKTKSLNKILVLGVIRAALAL